MMGKFPQRSREIMDERFGHDTVLALATVENGVPWVRSVNGYYEDGAFYVVTYARSNKMRQIKANPTVAVSGEWFTAHGVGENLGHILAEENWEIADKLRTVFAEWYDNGHTNEADPNTIILRIRLTDGILLYHGTRFDIDFS